MKIKEDDSFIDVDHKSVLTELFPDFGFKFDPSRESISTLAFLSSIVVCHFLFIYFYYTYVFCLSCL